jgi:hypothetical protein
LKIFGYASHALILKSIERSLIQSWSYVGWCGYIHMKAYMLFNPKINKVIFSHDVIFDERCIGSRTHNSLLLLTNLSSSKLNIPRHAWNIFLIIYVTKFMMVDGNE